MTGADDSIGSPSEHAGRGAGSQAPRLGLRARIPAIGLSEYWYPAIKAKLVGRRPVGLKVLGRDLVLFRDADDNVAALGNWCPHRNASLATGKCFFKGTITCPYHGLTFDGTGRAIAFLGEGPESPLPGHPAANARAYPCRTLHGLVFVWMGESPTAPIEEDVPPEFFDERALIQFGQDVWKANWRPSLENVQDAHAFFVHRNSLEVLSKDERTLFAFVHGTGEERPPTRVVNGRALFFEKTFALSSALVDPGKDEATAGAPSGPPPPDPAKYQVYYPQLKAKWPTTRWRLRLAMTIGAVKRVVARNRPFLVKDPEWTGIHLPTMYRVDMKSRVFTRSVVPIDEHSSRIFYYNTTYPSGPLATLRSKAFFVLIYNWWMNKNFSGQDKRAVENLNYDNPREKFSRSDAFPLAWRRFVIDHARQPQASDGSNGRRRVEDPTPADSVAGE